MPDDYGNNDRGAKYAFAMAFLFLIPGSLLTIVSRFKLIFLPRSIIEFFSPIAISPPEKQLIVAFYDQFTPVGQAKMNPKLFESLDIFGQQVCVVALLCFVLIVVIYILKARAGALYAPPTLILLPLFLVVIIALGAARLFFLYLLAVNADSFHPNLPTVLAAHYLMNAFAPEGLLIFTCLIAISLAQVGLLIYRPMSGAVAWCNLN